MPPIPGTCSRDETPLAERLGRIPRIDRVTDDYLEFSDSRWDMQMADYAQVLPLGQGHVRTALDVGSGTGGFAVAAASWGITVLCVDVNADHTPYLQVLSERGLLGILHDVREPLPMVEGAVDLVHCNDVLHWFTPGEIERVLSDWHRVLRPGGYVIVYFHQFSELDASDWYYERRLEAVDRAVMALGWKTLRRKTWTNAREEGCYRGTFQRP